MGRLTEFFDYLKVSPDNLQERKIRYCSFSITEETKKIRREYLESKRKHIKNSEGINPE